MQFSSVGKAMEEGEEIRDLPVISEKRSEITGRSGGQGATSIPAMDWLEECCVVYFLTCCFPFNRTDLTKLVFQSTI